VREPGQSVGDALKVAPLTIPVIGQPVEPNGESIAFHPDAHGYYTISEGAAQPLYYFARTDTSPVPPRVLVAPGADWDVSDLGEPLPPGWTTNLAEPSLVGPAPLGSGGGEQSTLESRVPTTYFRRQFTNGASPEHLVLAPTFSDGIAVYLNGTEIFRRHLAPGAVFDEFALAAAGDEARAWFSVPVNSALLRHGTNVLAAEVHRFEPEAPTLLFDLRLVEGRSKLPAAVTSITMVDGFCVGTVEGAPGRAVPIARSHDLLDWSPAMIVVLTNGIGTFAEPATNPATFFRIQGVSNR
jgi:hypothetical protein